jgi:hypothetical protein
MNGNAAVVYGAISTNLEIALQRPEHKPGNVIDPHAVAAKGTF